MIASFAITSSCFEADYVVLSSRPARPEVIQRLLLNLSIILISYHITSKLQVIRALIMAWINIYMHLFPTGYDCNLFEWFRWKKTLMTWNFNNFVLTSLSNTYLNVARYPIKSIIRFTVLINWKYLSCRCLGTEIIGFIHRN